MIAALYVLSPLLNLLQAWLFARVGPLQVIHHAVRGFGVPGLALIALGPVVGVGIYAGRRWGLAIFLLHAFGLVALASWRLVAVGPAAGRSLLMATNLVVFLFVGLMLTRNLRAPYLAREPRGWRRQSRVPCDLSMLVERGTQTYQGHLVDLSLSGALVTTRQVALTRGAALTLVLPFGGQRLTLAARVVRVTAAGFAVRFEPLTEPQEALLTQLIDDTSEGTAALRAQSTTSATAER
jgi:hypothetical protein